MCGTFWLPRATPCAFRQGLGRRDWDSVEAKGEDETCDANCTTSNRRRPLWGEYFVSYIRRRREENGVIRND